MRRVILSIAVLFAAATAAQAQEEYPRLDVYGGYSYFNSDQFPQRESLATPGFFVGAAGNVSKNFGLVGEISGHYGQATFPAGIRPDPEFDVSTYTFLFGPRFTARRENYDLFGHILVGAARTDVDVFGSETDFALAVGGGIDINVSKNIDVRLIQVDYLPIRAQDETAHNVRVSIGLVFRFDVR